jgi:nicotinamide riboside kinase
MSQSPLTIVLTGPESTGKTTLSGILSSRHSLPLVQEFAREYLQSRPGLDYGQDDVLYMASRQHMDEQIALLDEIPVVADTDLITFRIWLDVRFQWVPAYLDGLISEYASNQRYYLLCSPDIPWVHDPLRENPDDRKMLYNKHLELLEKYHLPYSVISGSYAERELQALGAVQNLLMLN